MQEIISLGFNCEVQFQIQRYFGSAPSSLFSWAFTSDDEKFLSALENIDDILSHGVHFHLVSQDMFCDEKYDITFHGRTPKNEMFDENGNVIDSVKIQEAIEELTSRTRHLKSKLHNSFNSDDEKIFIRKVFQTDEAGYGSVIAFCMKLNDILKEKVKNCNYKLILVFEEKELHPTIIEALKNENHIFLRTVDCFAPIENAQGGDFEGWNKIFDEFCDIDLAHQRANYLTSEIERLKEVICNMEKEMQRSRDENEDCIRANASIQREYDKNEFLLNKYKQCVNALLSNRMIRRIAVFRKYPIDIEQ